MPRLRFCLLLLLLWPGFLIGQEKPVLVTFLNVGQGDAILVRSPEGQTALIDSGPGVDIVGLLRNHGVDTLNLAVISHPHADHIGGMWQVLQSIPIRFYMDNGQPYTTTTYSAVMGELQDHPEITYLEATPRTLNLGSVVLHVLPNLDDASSNENNRSVGTVLEFGEFLGFLSGDSERSELFHFLQAGVVPDVSFLKAPHHGSDNGFTEAFLQASRPEVVVISVGAGNPFGHPGQAALRAYQAHADQLLRTDLHGEVTIAGYLDGSYEVALGGEVVEEGRGETSQYLGRVAPLPTPGEGAKERTDAGAAETISMTVFADAPGNDHQNLNGEYVVLTNPSALAIDLTNWVLCDLAEHCFTFPSGAQIAPEGQVFLFTGHGQSDRTRFFWGSSSAIWNNSGDTATLFDQGGRMIVQHVY